MIEDTPEKPAHRVVGRMYAILLENIAGDLRLYQPIRGDELFEDAWHDGRPVQWVGEGGEFRLVLEEDAHPPVFVANSR
jgi:hypothetical protein